MSYENKTVEQRRAEQQLRTKQRIERFNTIGNMVSLIESKNKETQDYLEEIKKREREERYSSKRQSNWEQKIHWYIKKGGIVIIKRGDKIIDTMPMLRFVEIKAEELNTGKQIIGAPKTEEE